MDGGASGGGGAEEASGERTAAELGPSLLCFRRDWASLAGAPHGESRLVKEEGMRKGKTTNEMDGMDE